MFRFSNPPRLLALVIVSVLGYTLACSDTTGPGAPESVEKVSGDGQEGVAGNELGDSLVVRVVDGNGNAVSGVAVSWQVESGGGTVSPASGRTGSDGRLSASWTLGTTAGANAARAVVKGLDPADFTATGSAGAPASVEKVSGDGQEGVAGSELGDSLVVRVVDGNGNAVSGVAVSWRVEGGGGTVTPASGSTGSDGRLSASWTLGTTAGANEARAVAEGLDPADFAATGTAGAPASVEKVSGDGQEGMAGSELGDSLVVRVVDGNSNAVSGVAVSWAVASGGGSLQPGTVNTDTNGRAAAAWSLGSAAGENEARATVEGLAPADFAARGLSWSAVGGGVNGGVLTLYPTATGLIAGGEFTEAGGDPVAYVARWDGDHWNTMGDLAAGTPTAFETIEGVLYAAGEWDSPIESVYERGVARWHDGRWHRVGGLFDSGVYAMALYEGSLIVGGEFTTVDGKTVNRLARWDGTEWRPIGQNGFNGYVVVLSVYEGDLLAAGNFSVVDGQFIDGIARWDGESWNPVGEGLPHIVSDVIEFSGDLFAATNRGIYRWNDGQWDLAAGGGMVLDLVEHNGKLVAGGWMTSLGGAPVRYLAQWDGARWATLGGGTDSVVAALAVFNSQLFVGGQFQSIGTALIPFFATLGM